MKKISLKKVLGFFIILSLILNITVIHLIKNYSTANPMNISNNEPEHETISTIGSRASQIVYDLDRNTNETHHNLTIYGAYNVQATGDLNGDNIQDLIISGETASFPGDAERTRCGAVYVIYGNTTQYPINIFNEVKDLTIYGVDSDDMLGTAVICCDVNADGIDDLIISAERADGENNLRWRCGEAYIIYGDPNLPPVWDLKYTPANVTISGADSPDGLGSALGTGDINNDGIDDILVGAIYAEGPNNARVLSGSGCGEVYVIYGNSSLPSKIDLKNNYDILIYGADARDQCGSTLTAGDLNNDSIDDLIIGANGAAGFFNNKYGSGEVHVIFSNGSPPAIIDLRNTSGNITIYGEYPDTIGGIMLMTGDLNGDNLNDLISGNHYAWGRNDNEPNTGEVWIMFGNDTYESTYNKSDIDITIYGMEEGDQFGYSMDVGDFNNDKYDDLMIGANGAGGSIDELVKQNAGEIYIFYGKSSWTKSDYDANLSDVIIYGADGPVKDIWNDAGDSAGSAVLFSDINGDGEDDILVGSSGDGRNNDRQTRGEICIILSGGGVVPVPEIYQVSLENGYGDDEKICYAGFKIPSHFKAKIVTHSDINDLKSADFTITNPLEPLNLQFGWTRATGEFYELQDPNNLFELSDKSSFSNDGIMTWTLNLHIIFNLSFSYGDYHKFDVHAERYTGYEDWLNLTRDMFRVETRFDFLGNLTVNGEVQGTIFENDWVHSGEEIAWSGLRVVYYDSNIIPPSNLGITVTVKDELGNQWTEDHVPAEMISINSTTINETKLNFTYRIKITDIPIYLDESDVNFHLNVDADDVEFSNRFPDPKVWHSTLRPECGISIKDPSTNISQASVQYRTSTNSGFIWSDWTKLGIHYELYNKTLNCTVKPIFKDGPENRIQWRAFDIVENNYNKSEIHQIRVDTSDVFFTNPIPSINKIQRALNVTCGITVSDDLSGVDAGTIDFSTSTSGIWDYGDWQPARKTVDSKEINCTVTPTFTKGSENYIRWRAKDLVGNGYHISDNYQINVKLNHPPVTKLISPLNNSLINILTPKLIWEGADPDNDTELEYKIFLSIDKAKVLSMDETVLIASVINKTQYQLEVPLEDETSYFWTVIPDDGIINGTCTSGLRQFRIDTKVELPIITLLEPIYESNTTSTEPKLSWKLDYTNPEIVKFNIYLAESTKQNLVSSENQFKKDYKLTTFILDKPLTPGEIYYWTVIPVAQTQYGRLEGFCQSGIWSFKVELPKEKIYGLDLAIEAKKLSVIQGNYTSTNISLLNKGNSADTITVSVDEGILEAKVSLERSGSPILLDKDGIIGLKLEILVSEDAKPQNYTISITATSTGGLTEGNDILNASVTKTITVEVLEKPHEPEDGEGKAETKESGIDYMIWSVLIILLILIIVMFAYIYRTRRIPYVKSELLAKPPDHLKLPGISTKPGTDLELPAAGEEGVVTLEGATVPAAYLLPKALLSREQKLVLLKERFILGEVSEETYKELKAELEISEYKDITKLDEVEPVDEMPEDVEAPELDEPVVDEEEPVDKESMEAMEEEPPSEVEDLEGLEVQETEDTEVVEKPEKEPEPSIGLDKEIKKPKKKKTAITKKKKSKKARGKKQKAEGPVEEPVGEDELHDIPEEAHSFPEDGLCVSCGQDLYPDMAYCWSCGMKYKNKDEEK